MDKETKKFVETVLSKYCDYPIDFDGCIEAQYELVGGWNISREDAVYALREICLSVGIGVEKDEVVVEEEREDAI